MVMPVVRLSELLELTATMSLVPSNCSALPYFPAAQTGPFCNVPVLELPEASAAVVPLVSLNEKAATRPTAGGV